MPGATMRVRLPALIVSAVGAAIYLGWEIVHRGTYDYATSVYPISDADEWRYTACSRLVEHGYALFTQVFSAQPPLLFLSLSAGMRLAGDSIAGARWTEIGFGFLGLAASSWLAWEIAGPVAGAVAGLLISVSPGFLVYSHTVEAEGPMMALVTLSLALAALSARKWTIGFAALSGLALAAAILMKLFAAEAVLPGLWLLVTSDMRRRPRPAVIAAYLGTVDLPVVLDFALWSPRQQWDQVILLHDRAAGLHLSNMTPPLQIVGQFLGLDIGMSALALAGIVGLVLGREWRPAGLLILWLPGTIGMLLLFEPLFPHHAAILSSALSVSAGVAVTIAVRISVQHSTIVPVAAAVAVYAVFVLRLAHADRHVLIPWNRPAVAELARYTDRMTTSRDLVAADDLEVADRAGRLVVPPLCDPSNVRLQSGFLTASDLIGATKRYRPALVLSSFGIYRQVPGYAAWLDRHYKPAQPPAGPSAMAYVRR